jgi:hypothetical protein
MYDWFTCLKYVCIFYNCMCSVKKVQNDYFTCHTNWMLYPNMYGTCMVGELCAWHGTCVRAKRTRTGLWRAKRVPKSFSLKNLKRPQHVCVVWLQRCGFDLVIESKAPPSWTRCKDSINMYVLVTSKSKYLWWRGEIQFCVSSCDSWISCHNICVLKAEMWVTKTCV